MAAIVRNKLYLCVRHGTHTRSLSAGGEIKIGIQSGLHRLDFVSWLDLGEVGAVTIHADITTK